MHNLSIKRFAEKFLLQKISQLRELEEFSLSGRQYFLVITEDSQQFLVSKFSKDDEKSFSDFIDIQSLLSKHQINVPKVLGIDHKNFLIIQQYIGEHSLYKVVLSKEVNDERIISFYKQALDLLMEMQKIDDLSIISERSFNFDKILNEYKIFIKPYLIDVLWKNQIDNKQEKQFQEFYSHLSLTLSDVPRVFCHRDFQSTNLILDKNQKIFAIDFQGARMALPQYDLVSLLEDNYILLPSRIKTILVDYYIKHSEKKLNKQIDIREFKRIYRYTLIQRKLHDLAIFIRADVKENNDQYLKYLVPNLKILVNLLQKEGVVFLFLEIYL